MAERYGLETGQLKLLEAKALISTNQPSEAEILLSDAERVFRDFNDTEGLCNVLINKSQVKLCRGQIPLAINDIEEALSIGRGTANKSRYRQMLFYRGLAHLAIGRELDAHQDLVEYIDISENVNDFHAQAVGHFYHALAFERHGEPCMAMAELEVAKDIIQDRYPSLTSRLNAFVAHLWLRKGHIDESEALIDEALKLIGDDAKKIGAANLGMVFIARAEIFAKRSRWEESKEALEQSVHMFKLSRYGLYLEALAHAWYGETLITSGRKKQGYGALLQAKSIYSRLANESQESKVDAAISECKRESFDPDLSDNEVY